MTKKFFSKFFKLYFLFAVFMLPLVFFQRCEDAYYLPKLAILAGGAMFLPSVFISFFRKKPDIIDILAAGFLTWYVVSAGMSMAAVRHAATAQRVAEWLGAVSFFLYARRFLGPDDIKKSVTLALSSAVLVCTYAVLQVFNIDLKGWAVNFSGRAFSSLGNPDFLWGFIVMSAPLCFYFVRNDRKWPAAVFAFMSAVLVLSQTRSSLAAFGAAVVILIFFFPEYISKQWPLLASGAAVAAILLVISGNAGHFISRVAEASSPANPDMSGRTGMWMTGLRMIRAGMITGIGPGLIGERYCHYRQSGGYFETDHLHNDCIEIFAEAGAPAFICFIAVVVLSLIAMLKKREPLQMAAFAGMAGMLAHAFFNFPMYIMDTKLFFFVVAGMALSYGAEEKTDAPAALSGIVFAVLLMAAVLRMLLASSYMNHSVNGVQADMAGADYSAGRAMAIQPGAKSLYYRSRIDMAKGDWEACARDYNVYNQSFACSKPMAINAGIAYAEMKNYEASLRSLNDFLYFYPGDTDILNNKAKVLFMSGDTEGAIGLYGHVLTLDPWNETAHENLYAILKGTGKVNEAAEEEQRWREVSAQTSAAR